VTRREGTDFYYAKETSTLYETHRRRFILYIDNGSGDGGN
jgi:hypothetical protein